MYTNNIRCIKVSDFEFFRDLNEFWDKIEAMIYLLGPTKHRVLEIILTGLDKINK